ncbi:MAG TPA: hypothetical protein VNC39_09905 [Acidocella sp.]|jgi:hypothetical protein|uniref:hypothetical protein n=1 Tax=Acidocella sp. TaxID=50710 RepID=UPI002C4D4F6B|nr:hypothetical protein [Acidocella sp.]HVE22281.1 hypothetical protein [Acidocella sp.]
MHNEVLNVVFDSSKFWPVAIGFIGLATGYVVMGGQALFQYPQGGSEAVEKTVAMWGAWMAGFMQFITGVYLIIGLTWFGVFNNAAPLYMAAVAFTAYGVHWFAVSHRRFIGSSPVPEGWMAIVFTMLSILGMIVFAGAGDTPVAILFFGLTLVYITEIPARLCHWTLGTRLVGLWQFLTGLWLIYLTYGVVLNLALGYHWWV